MNADSLEQLLELCVQEEPWLLGQEDCLPEDPRDVVKVRLGERIVRLFPGTLERPIADVDRALLVANAVDEVLNDTLGFGVRNVLDVALAYIDWAMEQLAPAWPHSAKSQEGTSRLSQAEVEAAREVVAAGTPSALTATDSSVRALEWLTCDAADFSYTGGHPQSPFGRFLRVRGLPWTEDDEAHWIPLAFIPEVLSYAIGKLAHEAAISQEAQTKFAQLAAQEVRRSLWSFGTAIYGPQYEDSTPVPVRDNAVQWVSLTTGRRAVAVQLTSGLRLSDLQAFDLPEALRLSRETPSETSDSVNVDMSVGRLELDPRIEIVPLHITATPHHIVVPQRIGLPAMSMDDLRWASLTADRPTDLFTFCREMARGDRPPLVVFEAIDVWESWRKNGKSLYRGGQQPSLIVVEPHAGTAEWRRAVSLSATERALLKLCLPPIRALAGMDERDDGPPTVYVYAHHTPASDEDDPIRPLHRRPGLDGWSLHTGAVPVAVTAIRSEWNDELVGPLRELSIAVAAAVDANEAVWTSIHDNTNVSCYHIDLVPGPTIDERAFHWIDRQVESSDDGDVVYARLAVSVSTLANVADADPTLVRNQLASAFSDLVTAVGVDTEVADAFEENWRKTKPTFAVRITSLPTVRNELPQPIGLDHAIVAQVEQRIAVAVRDAGLRPGRYTGDQAKSLDRDVLAPAALAALDEAISAHSMDTLVEFGMQQIERAVNHKNRALLELGQTASLMDVGLDPVERYREAEADYLWLRRCCETAVESALRSAPDGAMPVDQIAWSEVLAAAHAYLQATNRSEGVHYQLSPTLIDVSDLYEITTDLDPGESTEGNGGSGASPYHLDVPAFGRALAEERIARDIARDISGETNLEPPGEGSSSSRHGHDGPDTDDFPDAQPITNDLNMALDSAMFNQFGASGTEIAATLFALSAWPLGDTDGDAVVVCRDDLVQHVVESTHLRNTDGGEERAMAAIDMLTSKSAELAQEDWKPWHARSRKRRLLVQPIPELSDGQLVVAPHLCYGAATVYLHYFEQGQLPWAQPQPPVEVEKALEAIRDERNQALERLVGSTLRKDDWSVIERVKESKAARLNVPSLQTEIDAVAGKAGCSSIWLLEVKDPSDVAVIPEIRRSLDRFYLDGSKHKGYATQLQRKYDDLQPYAAEVARALGLPDRAEGAESYVIRPLFVTRVPVAAGYVGGPFPFATLLTLLSTVNTTDGDE
ncbi:hypothetical protein H7I41_03965 [Mycobacterium manitobense]|uniref:Uncharacterized protein n=1 Tax=[Mycobacterium] manitobense TaxID=190147 RepID=A0A9X3BL94_9MYCO|nr:hypothetical protein [[Mycobacterium] manitobense]MCV7169079.1 hypothetical protein [[Mycobacterium] manitobense]